MLFGLGALAEANASPVQDVVDEMGDLIEHAGDKAGNLLTNLPHVFAHLPTVQGYHTVTSQTR